MVFIKDCVCFDDAEVPSGDNTVQIRLERSVAAMLTRKKPATFHRNRCKNL